MISYGQLKNNIQIIRKFFIKNNVTQNSDLTIKHCEQQTLRSNNPQYFIQIIHYLLIIHSSDLYREVLSICPQIKLANDKRFMELAYLVFRKILEKHPSLTVDQFLTNKYFQAKVIFIAQLTKSVNNWISMNTQGPKPTSNPNQKTKGSQQDQGFKKYMPVNYASDQQEEQQPKTITVSPLSLDSKNSQKSQPNKLYEQANENYNYVQPSIYETNENQRTLVQYSRQNKTPNVFPKNQNDSYSKYLREIYDEQPKQKFNPEANMLKKQKKVQHQPVQSRKSSINNHQRGISSENSVITNSYAPTVTIQQPFKTQRWEEQQQSQEDSVVSEKDKPVTRQQFNQYLELVTTMNGTINSLVQKFNSFQSSMLTWVNNSNAKMSMMEENIKFLKSNI